MSDWELPDLPSDEELGITDEDREKYGEDLSDDGPEMSPEERSALLGGSAGSKAGAEPGKGDPAKRKEAAKAAKRAAGERKRAAREERRRAKEEKRRAKEERRRAKEEERRGERGERLGAEGAHEATTRMEAETPGSTPPPGGAGRTPVRSPASDPRRPWRGPATLAILLVLAAVASTRTGLPRTVPANAADTSFSSARAMSLLVSISRAPRPTGSPEHARVRSLLVERLRALGLEPEIQTTTSILERPGTATVATVRNVMARLPGTQPTGTILVTAHYDSHPTAVGAADDGSGVVSILEAVRALQASGPVRNDIVILLTDAEELGLLGARAFIAQHPLVQEVDLVLSFEMRGGGGPSIMFETNELNGWVVRALHGWGPKPYANSMSYEIYRRMPNDTDFTPFKRAGFQGLNFAAIDNAHVYHQVYDTPENLSEPTLQHHGLQALGALRHFGGADLSAVNASNVVYFTVPGLGLIVYGQGWVLPLSLALLVLTVSLVLLTLRVGARPLGIAGGAGVSVAVAGVAFALASGLLRWLPRMHQEFGALNGSALHSEGWYMLALVFATLGVASVLTSLARPWLSLAELSVGSLLIPALMAIVLGFVTPLAAMNLQWPVIAALMAATTVALLGRRAEGMVGWLAALLFAVPVIFILQPVIEVVWLAMSLRLLGVLAVLVALGLMLCVPAVASLRHPNVWWAPGTALALAAFSTGAGWLAGRPSEERPAPSTLVYAYEHGTGSAFWATDADGSAGETLGGAWAAERIAGSFEQSRDLSAFGYPFGEVPVAPAPMTDAPPPAITIVGDTVFSGARIVVMEVRSSVGAELVRFDMDERTRLNAINGVMLSEPETLRRVDHWGIPEDNLLLELSMPTDAPIGVHVVEHLLRPAELLGPRRFERPEHLAPNILRWSDRAMFRFSVAHLADPRHAIVAPRPEDIRTPPPEAGVPDDTLVIRPDTLIIDTMIVDTVNVDPVIVDTANVDTLTVDTATVDATTVDTIPRDTTDTASAVSPARRQGPCCER